MLYGVTVTVTYGRLRSSRTAVCGRNVLENSASIVKKKIISSHHEKSRKIVKCPSAATDKHVKRPGAQTDRSHVNGNSSHIRRVTCPKGHLSETCRHRVRARVRVNPKNFGIWPIPCHLRLSEASWIVVCVPVFRNSVSRMIVLFVNNYLLIHVHMTRTSRQVRQMSQRG